MRTPTIFRLGQMFNLRQPRFEALLASAPHLAKQGDSGPALRVGDAASGWQPDRAVSKLSEGRVIG